MATQNASNQKFTNQADGFVLGGGTVQRNLTLTGADITLTGTGSNTYTFPSAADTLVGRSSTDTLTNKTLSSPAFSGSYSFGGTPTWPTFNQNTTGSAATLTTSRNFQTDLASTSAVGFNGSANNTHGVTGTLATANGGTGRATSTTAYGIIAAGTTAAGAQQTIAPGTAGQFLKSAGGAALASFASIQLSDLSDSSSVVTLTGGQTLANKTLTTPTIASFANAAHNHTNAAGGGQITATTALNATGTPTSSTYLRGDNTWATLAASGDASTNTSTSVDGEVVLFSGTGGKTLKRATGSGLAKLTSGVLSTATAGTDYVTPSGTETLSNKTFTGSKMDGIIGLNSTYLFTFNTVTSAFNHISITNAATGNSPQIGVVAPGDTNANLWLVPKGSGQVQIYGFPGQTPTLAAIGGDANYSLNLVTKGTGTVQANGVDVATISGTQTFTNKTLSSPTFSGSYSFGGTPTWPTFNQNTTGSAATLTTSRNFLTDLSSTSAVGFNGSANNTHGVTGTLAVANGGTGRATSTTAYGIIAAGTTATGTQQTIAPGTAGQFLKSAGGSSLASFASLVATDISDSSAVGRSVIAAADAAAARTAIGAGTGDGDVTLTGLQTLSGKTLANPIVNSYTEGVVAIGTVTTTSTLDLTNGTILTATLTASTACVFTMPTATAGKSFVLLLNQAASTGGGTASFTGVKWNGGGAPTVTSTAGTMDILSFFADGTNWYGSYSQGYTI